MKKPSNGRRPAAMVTDTLDLPEWAQEFVCGELLNSPAGVWVMAANNLSMAIGVAEQLTFEASEVSGAEAFVKRRVGRVLLDESIRQLRASGRQLSIPLAKAGGKGAETQQATLVRGLLEQGLHADYYIPVSKEMRRMLGPIATQLIENALPFASRLIAKLGEGSDDTSAEGVAGVATFSGGSQSGEALGQAPAGGVESPHSEPIDNVFSDPDEADDLTEQTEPEVHYIEYPAFYPLAIRLACRRHDIEVSTASEQSLISLLSDSADTYDELLDLASFVDKHRLSVEDESEQAESLDELTGIVKAILANQQQRTVPDLLLRRYFDRSWVRLFRQRRERPPAGLLIRVLLRYYIAETYEPGLFVDLGCGSGVAARYMLKDGWRVFACDHRPAAQESILAGLTAGQKSRLEFVQGRCEDIELPSDADIIWADRSLPRDRKHLMTVLKRTTMSLRPGGYFFADLSTHANASVDRIDSLLGKHQLHDVQRFSDNHFARCMARLANSSESGESLPSTPTEATYQSH